MKRFIDYRTLDKETPEYEGIKLWSRNSLEIETPTFQDLADVIVALDRWYSSLDIIRIENLDFKKIEELQLMDVYKEEERRGRHGKRKKKKEEDDDTMPF